MSGNKKHPPSSEWRSIKGAKRIRLIQERKKRKLTQKELGLLIGVSSSTISFLENGRMNPSLEVSMGLQELFDLEYEILFPDF